MKIKDKNQKTNKNQNSPPIKIQYLQSAKIQIFYIITLKKSSEMFYAYPIITLTKNTKDEKFSFIDEKNALMTIIFVYGR